jgi:glycosyltransferase involved in cell wall biosynthesis
MLAGSIPIMPHASGDLRISVVMATLNRPQLLDRCLGALSNQTLPLSAYEVIVVDDGPHAATEAVVQDWGRRCPAFSVRYLTSAQRHGPAAARNVGWRAARAEVIAFTDDDCIPAPGWLAAGLTTLMRAQVGAAWGRIVVPISERPSDWERNVAGLERAPCATANCFYRRGVLESVGGFDERFTEAWREDSDLQFGALAKGVTIVHQPEALVTHPVRPARWGISIALQRQNRFNALLYKKHPQFSARFNPHEPPWAYYGAVALVLLGGMAAAGGAFSLALTLWGGWMAMAAAFCLRRLRGATRRPAHVVEMIATSLVIPPYAIFWRLYGAVRYRVAFF